MSGRYKPQGYTSVAPYLILSNAAATLTFLEQALDAVEIRHFSNDHGGVMHAEVRIDDTVLMLADGGPDWLPDAAHVHVYVPDVDTSYARALAAGATMVQAPVKQGDADKRGGVMDANGITWWLATMVEEQ